MIFRLFWEQMLNVGMGKPNVPIIIIIIIKYCSDPVYSLHCTFKFDHSIGRWDVERS